MAHLRENLKLNWKVQMPGASWPSSLQRVRPIWIIFRRSTLQRSVW